MCQPVGPGIRVTAGRAGTSRSSLLLLGRSGAGHLQRAGSIPPRCARWWSLVIARALQGTTGPYWSLMVSLGRQQDFLAVAMQENRCQLSVSAYSGFYFYIAFKILSARRLKGKHQYQSYFLVCIFFTQTARLFVSCQLRLSNPVPEKLTSSLRDCLWVGDPARGDLGNCAGTAERVGSNLRLGEQNILLSAWEGRDPRAWEQKGNMCHHVAAAGTCPAFASTGWIKLKMLPHSSLQQHGEYKGGC